MPAALDLTAARRALAANPALLPLAAALATLAGIAAEDGGFEPATWLPAALFIVGLTAVCALALGGRRPPAAGVAATALLAAYAAWSYLSIAWADDQGTAWDGANRTALYAVIFGLFALAAVRGRPAAALVGGWSLAIALIALVELLRAAGAEDPAGFVIDGRLSEPVGYPNANVALWFGAFWPCVLLGARREMHPLGRAAFVAAAVVLAAAALLGQSRGWLFSLAPVMAIFLALAPARVRTTLTLVIVCAATGLAAPVLLDVYEAADRDLGDAFREAARATVIAAAAAAAVAAVLAVLDRQRRPSRAAGRRAGAVLAGAALVAAAAGLVVFVEREGSPFTVAADAWEDFRSLEETPTGGESSRLGGSLGSNRYDFWRVAVDRFADEPVRGIGADNFQQDYLADRRSIEEPRYPHSVELRTLSQTGLVGAVLLGAALALALACALAARRRRSGPGAAAAAAAVAVFAYWLVHGSVDWFWEFPALGGAAFAMLGIAAGLWPRAPRRTRPARRQGRPPAGRAQPLVALALGVALAATAVSLAAPWLAERHIARAAETWPVAPRSAFERLDRAAGLNPLSARPDLVAASIALRLGDLRRAEERFLAALERSPREAYAHLELGLIAADRGRRGDARRHLARAIALNPRSDIPRDALAAVRRGERVSIERVNREILRRSRSRVR